MASLPVRTVGKTLANNFCDRQQTGFTSGRVQGWTLPKAELPLLAPCLHTELARRSGSPSRGLYSQTLVPSLFLENISWDLDCRWLPASTGR